MNHFVPQMYVEAIAANLRESLFVSLRDDRDEYTKAADRERWRLERADAHRAKAELWDKLKLSLQKTPNSTRMWPGYVAVRELVIQHRPVFDFYNDGRCGECVESYSWGAEDADWPCHTITTIADAFSLFDLVERATR